MTPPFKVVVTGFGPFRDHKVNASWVAVKKMKETGGLGPDIDLEIVEIEVDYATVDNKIPKLWKKHNPKLMIHVGVSGRARAITLEEIARIDGYRTPDIKGNCPRNNCCKKSGDPYLRTVFDMQQIAKEEKEINPRIEVETSQDAGRYLCEYIYYTSMSLKRGPCAFIHVPPLNRTYSDEELAEGLRTIIKLMVKQLQSSSR